MHKFRSICALTYTLYVQGVRGGLSSWTQRSLTIRKRVDSARRRPTRPQTRRCRGTKRVWHAHSHLLSSLAHTVQCIKCDVFSFAVCSSREKWEPRGPAGKFNYGGGGRRKRRRRRRRSGCYCKSYCFGEASRNLFGGGTGKAIYIELC